MKKSFNCGALSVLAIAVIAVAVPASAAASGNACSGRPVQVKGSHNKLKVDYVILVTCKSGRKLALAASARMARLANAGRRSHNITIKGFPGWRCDNTANGDQVGNYYFSCSQKLSKHKSRLVNWTFGPQPV